MTGAYIGDVPETAAASAESGIYEAPNVLRMLWADPQHMPEQLALWSLKHFGPRAAGRVETLRATHPDADTSMLQAAAIEHQTRVAMTEGAFVGGPFILLIPVAFCAALLAQAQLSLEVAALAGYSPDDEMRAADFLVIQGAYASTADARAALADVVHDPARREGKRLPRGSRIAMVMRMAYMLGLLGASGEKSRFRSVLDGVLVCVVFLIGIVLPLVWVPYMAWSFRKSTVQVGARASALYAERSSRETGISVRKAPSVNVGLSAGFVRMLALIAVPVIVAVVALLTDAHIGTGRWLSALLLLLVLSALGTLGWFVFRAWRRRRLT